MYLATLVDLPTLIEAQKTLDFRTFFKSTDVAQLLYIHNRVLDSFSTRTADEVIDFAEGFKPFAGQDDPEFLQQLYRRGEITRRAEESKKQAQSIGGGAAKTDLSFMGDMMKYRHGLAPPTKNIRNIRFKKEPNEDPNEVHAVEKILKDIIDVSIRLNETVQYGFADNVEEELLKFGPEGELKERIQGAKDKKQIKPQMLGHHHQFGGDINLGTDQVSMRSESMRDSAITGNKDGGKGANGSGRKKNKSRMKDGQSSMYSQSQPGNPDYDEDEEEEDEDDEDDDDDEEEDEDASQTPIASVIEQQPAGPTFIVPLNNL